MADRIAVRHGESGRQLTAKSSLHSWCGEETTIHTTATSALLYSLLCWKLNLATLMAAHRESMEEQLNFLIKLCHNHYGQFTYSLYVILNSFKPLF